MTLRETLLANLPGITEHLDISARMVGYCYGQKYIDLICVIIPSKNGLKLGFNRGIDLPDPDNLLEGAGKISCYISIRSEKQINSVALKKLLLSALLAYKQRVSTREK